MSKSTHLRPSKSRDTYKKTSGIFKEPSVEESESKGPEFKLKFADDIISKDTTDEEGLITASNFSWSPNGEYFAISIKHRILIRNGRKLTLHQTYSLSDGVNTKMDELKWSSDSLYLAAVWRSEGVVSIRRVDQPNWKCRIDLGDERKGVGLLDFCWSPDARHILTTSAFYTQLTVWSLCRSMVTSFRNVCQTPKYKSFSCNGNLLAVAHFDSEFNTRLSIYESKDWNLKDSFPVITKDLVGVDWCPNGSCILLWDSPLFSNLYVYSTSGQMLKHYSPDGLSVGIQSIRWSPTGQLLALTNHRNTLRILNGLTFGVLAEEEMEISLTQQNIHKDCTLYREILTETAGSGIQHEYELDKTWSWSSCTEESFSFGNIITPTHRMDVLDQIKFSWDGYFIACTSAGHPNRLWIWNLKNVTLSTLLVHLMPVTDFQWDPNDSRLTICTGGHCVYFWTPTKTYVKSISSFTSDKTTATDFKAEMISWNPQGISFAAQNVSSGRTIVGFLNSCNNKV